MPAAPPDGGLRREGAPARGDDELRACCPERAEDAQRERVLVAERPVEPGHARALEDDRTVARLARPRAPLHRGARVEHGQVHLRPLGEPVEHRRPVGRHLGEDHRQADRPARPRAREPPCRGVPLGARRTTPARPLERPEGQRRVEPQPCGGVPAARQRPGGRPSRLAAAVPRLERGDDGRERVRRVGPVGGRDGQPGPGAPRELGGAVVERGSERRQLPQRDPPLAVALELRAACRRLRCVLAVEDERLGAGCRRPRARAAVTRGRSPRSPRRTCRSAGRAVRAPTDRRGPSSGRTARRRAPPSAPRGGRARGGAASRATRRRAGRASPCRRLRRAARCGCGRRAARATPARRRRRRPCAPRTSRAPRRDRRSAPPRARAARRCGRRGAAGRPPPRADRPSRRASRRRRRRARDRRASARARSARPRRSSPPRRGRQARPTRAGEPRRG